MIQLKSVIEMKQAIDRELDLIAEKTPFFNMEAISGRVSVALREIVDYYENFKYDENQYDKLVDDLYAIDAWILTKGADVDDMRKASVLLGEYISRYS